MPKDNHTFAQNLQHVVGYFPSVVQAAGKLGINRQQLTKYLSGTSTPSLATLRTIASYFGVEPDDMFLPQRDFKKRWSPPAKVEGLPPQLEGTVQDILYHMHRTHGDMDEICGFYHAYINLLTHPNKIGRAYTVIQRHGDFTAVKTIMFASPYGAENKPRRPIKINGIALYLGERIYILDAQNVGQPNARIQSIALYPSSFPQADYLTGLLMTTNNARNRPIYSTPIVFQRLNADRIRKDDMRACGVFFRDSGNVAPDILELLNSVQR